MMRRALGFAWSLRPSRREAVAMMFMVVAILVLPVGGMYLHYVLGF